MWRVVGVAMLLVLSSARHGAAQFAVIEAPGPLLSQSVFNSFQNFITAGEAVIHTANWALTLESAADTGLSGTFETDLDDLEGIISETQGILWDARRLVADVSRLFGVTDVPEATTGLEERLRDIRLWCFEQRRRAWEIQTLPGRVRNVVARIRTLWGRILGILGQKQGSQQEQAMLQQVQYLEAQSQVISGAFHQATLCELMERPVIAASVRAINTEIYGTLPR
jgi:hypothetical protein